MSDLHERIAAELDRREDVARRAAANCPPPWGYLKPSMQVIDVHQDWVAEMNSDPGGEYFYMHDPADALRRYAAARRVLERHREIRVPVLTPIGAITVCGTCSDLDQDTYRVVGYPCWEIRDLAASLGLEVDDVVV